MIKHLFYGCFVAIIYIQSGKFANAEENESLFLDSFAEEGFRNLSYIAGEDTITLGYWPLGFRDEFQAYTSIKRDSGSLADKNAETVILDQYNWEFVVYVPFSRFMVQLKALNTAMPCNNHHRIQHIGSSYSLIFPYRHVSGIIMIHSSTRPVSDQTFESRFFRDVLYTDNSICMSITNLIPKCGINRRI